VLRRKRAVFSSAQQVLGLISWLEDSQALEPPAAIGLVRHNVEPITGSLRECLAARYPHAVIDSFEHLDCHAALGAVSGQDRVEVIALDGGGDRRVLPGRPNALVQSWDGGKPAEPRLFDAEQLPIDGRAWTILSHALFDDAHAAGKTMGLAAYGQPCQQADEAIAELIRRSLAWCFDRPTIYQISDALPLQDFQAQANAAYALQEAFTAAMLELAGSAARRDRDLVLTGGCALNVTANTELSRLCGRVWVPPCPGDEGISMGAAILAAAGLGERAEPARFPYLGLGDEQLPSRAEFRKAAELLARGQVLVTAIGRGEVGPRALGNRSFLALPTVANKHRVSEQMKGREHFRPVAPAMRGADLASWLTLPIDSPYMSFASPVTQAMRDCCAGAVHVDGSARHQSVDPDSHPALSALLDGLAELGVPPVLINTSLNVAGSPICLDRSDALATALATGADGILTGEGFSRLS
jgi:carbamoyltransferase